jgi:hypothetical protein
MKRVSTVIALCAGVFAAPSAARAQDVPLSELLVDLIQSDIRLAPPPPGFPSHEAHFIPGADQQIAPYFFNQQLIAQLATFPIGSPSGGFSYMFDSASGTFQRATQSFGPAFAERALTIGRGKLSFGMNFQHSNYSSFEGADLDDGEVKFYLRHAPTGGNFFEGDVIEAALNLDVSSTTTTFFANYGLTNRWDVALAVPLQRVSMDATVDATVLRLATGTTPIHSFPNGSTQQTFTDSGTASGLGDMLVRTKFRFLDSPSGGLAAGLDIRLPTGDADNLLGTGTAQTGITLIGSSAAGAFAPHFNIGYTFSGDSDVATISDEFEYRVGTEFVVNPRVTLSADLLGRSLRDSGRLEFGDTTWNYRDAAGGQHTTTFHELTSQSGSLSLTTLAAGGKFNVAGNLLINANLLFALSSAGVTASVTPVIGFDYSF